MRHTLATQLIRDGKDPILVVELLGHGSPDTNPSPEPPTKPTRPAL
ncbi:hypothetical protein [Nonomuraea sp. CA-141351]